MAAPEYVPNKPAEKVRSYTSPPWSGDPWHANRPGDLEASQPRGDHLGNQGPDQGYALTLTHLFDADLRLKDGEHRADVDAGVVLVALKRASLFGRAPVKHDLEIAYTMFGFFDAQPDPDLVAFRKGLFAEAHHFHHYADARKITAVVDDEMLRKTPDEVADAYRLGWKLSFVEAARL